MVGNILTPTSICQLPWPRFLIYRKSSERPFSWSAQICKASQSSAAFKWNVIIERKQMDVSTPHIWEDDIYNAFKKAGISQV
ncbi:MAG: hypothetical protein ACPHX7_09560, partial [Candidatus Puniceispirillaceae bacterium]